MSGDKVVPWRPRDQVLRTIESFISKPPELGIWETVPVKIDPKVHVGRLIRGLESVGIVFRRDIRTNTIVIMPAPESSQEDSES